MASKTPAVHHPSLFQTLPGRKPGPIVPRHEPIPAGNVSRLLLEVPSGGGMGPRFPTELIRGLKARGKAGEICRLCVQARFLHMRSRVREFSQRHEETPHPEEAA